MKKRKDSFNVNLGDGYYTTRTGKLARSVFNGKGRYGYTSSYLELTPEREQQLNKRFGKPSIEKGKDGFSRKVWL